MSQPYDCTNDVRQHQRDVRRYMNLVIMELDRRALVHDDSKLTEPEKSCYDKWKPVLEATPFGTPEYDAAVRQMGEGLRAHFQNNRHHPEHFNDGVEKMNLIDLIEMLCDWMAVSERKGTVMAWNYLFQKFAIKGDLASVLMNTHEDMQALP